MNKQSNLEKSRAVDHSTLFTTGHEIGNFVVRHVLRLHVAGIWSAINDIIHFTVVQCLQWAGVSRVAIDVPDHWNIDFGQIIKSD